MSYILDALRRADAERDRGRVPGIHAQVPPPAADDPVPRRGGEASPARWIAVGVALGLLVVFGAWLWLGREAPPATLPAAAMNPPPPIPQPEPRPAPPPPAPAPAATAERPADALPPIEQRPTAEAAAAAARKAAAAASRPGAPASAPAAAAPPAAAPPQGAGRIYGRHELPEEIRRQLPAVTIGGSIYSPSPANRFVVINGQVVHEGGSVGPDHVLETIKLKSAVLRFQGYRYELLF